VWLSGQRRDTGADHDAPDLWLGLHFHWEPAEFRLPEPRAGHRWVMIVDTTEEPGFNEADGAPVCGPRLTLGPRSLAIVMEMPYTGV
jgi:glycogen operon protein